MAVLTIGPIGNLISEIESEISLKVISHFNMRFVKPLDQGLLHDIFQEFDAIITIEDGTIKGGFGSAILEFSNSNNFQNKNIKLIGVPDHFIEHGTILELHHIAGIDKESIKNEIEKLL